MKSKRTPPSVPWLAAGAVLFLCSHIPSGGNWEVKLRICGISSFVAAFLWFLLPEFMENHRRKLYGIWLILVGAYLAYTELLGGSMLAGMGGLFVAVLGIGFLVINIP